MTFKVVAYSQVFQYLFFKIAKINVSQKLHELWYTSTWKCIGFLIFYAKSLSFFKDTTEHRKTKN